MPAADGAARTAAPRTLALAVGAFYTLLGIAGFGVTGFEGASEHAGHQLLGVAVHPTHNVVHLVVGVAGLALARRPFGVQAFGWLLLLGFGASFVYGLVATGESWDLLGLDWANNWVHLVSALIGLGLTLVPPARAPEPWS
jgi:hypothetical protein